jgi:hypothetical protein
MNVEEPAAREEQVNQAIADYLEAADAGHYRGEPFHCLELYCVGVRDDRRVGVSPGQVSSQMGKFAALANRLFAGLDAGIGEPDNKLSPRGKVKFIVALACKLLETFLTIHPYANGNGHIGRFIIWAVLGRYGHWLKRFPIHPRPPQFVKPRPAALPVGV